MKQSTLNYRDGKRNSQTKKCFTYRQKSHIMRMRTRCWHQYKSKIICLYYLLYPTNKSCLIFTACACVQPFKMRVSTNQRSCKMRMVRPCISIWFIVLSKILPNTYLTLSDLFVTQEFSWVSSYMHRHTFVHMEVFLWMGIYLV